MKTLLLLFICESVFAQMLAVPRTQASGLRENPRWSWDHFQHKDYAIGFLEEGSPTPVGSKILDAKLWAVGGYDRNTLESKRVNPQENYAGYHDYNALTAILKEKASLYPGLVRLETAGKSIQGREIWYVVVSDSVNEDEHEPKFIYHANMHGDEVVGRELMLYFLDHLLEQYGKDPKITQLIENAEIFIMPSMNPDGFELRTRENSKGKDLNRNFPDRFNSPTDSGAGREVEVQRMVELAHKHHFVYGINWHGGEICFNLPWGNIINKPENKYGDDSFFNPIGREYTELNKPMYANHHGNFDHGLTYGYEWYPVNGGINDWFNFYRRSVHSVIELTTTKWPNASTLPKHWDDNREAMVTYLWRGLRGIHLRVLDGAGKPAKNVTVAIDSLPKRPLMFDDGYVHRLTGDGMQIVTVSANGFTSQTVKLNAWYFSGEFVTVSLTK